MGVLEYDIEPCHIERAWDWMFEANTGCGLGSYENVLSYLAWSLLAIISGDTNINSFSFDDIHAKYDSPEAVYNLNLTPEFARALSIIITFP